MDELAKRFAELADKYGPGVANAAIEAARTEAYSTLASAVMAVLFAAGLGYPALLIARKILAGDWEEPAWIFVAFLGFGSVVAGAIAMWAVIDPWTWTAINHPELWIAKKAFKL